MCKQKMFKKCVVLVVLLIAVPHCFAGTWFEWTNGSGNQEWLDAGNWSSWQPVGPPGAGDIGCIFKTGSSMPIIDAADNAQISQVNIGYHDGNFNLGIAPGALRMTGGSLSFTAGQWFQLSLGYFTDDDGTMYMEGGSINSNSRIVAGCSIWGPGGVGRLIMSGGSITTTFAADAQGLGVGSNSFIDLSGGRIEAESLTIVGNGYVNITGTGILVLRNSLQTTDVDALIAAGSIRGTDLQVIRDGAQITIIPEPCTLVLMSIAGSLVVLRKRNSR